MRGSGTLGRLLAMALGGVLVFGGLAAVTLDRAASSASVWLIVAGLAVIVAAAVERWRYRSETAERDGLPVGPGGGEPTAEALEGRFRRTEEVFVDPTSGRRMRVWLDGVTGERRYRAED